MVKSDIIEELTTHYDNIDRLKIKDLISFNYIYDNSEKKTGIILEIEKDQLHNLRQIEVGDANRRIDEAVDSIYRSMDSRLDKLEHRLNN